MGIVFGRGFESLHLHRKRETVVRFPFSVHEYPLFCGWDGQAMPQKGQSIAALANQVLAKSGDALQKDCGKGYGDKGADGCGKDA